MRIALHPTAEVGTRVGLILLAERSLIALGLYGGVGELGADRRTMRISALTGFDLLVTDDPDPVALVAIAVEDGLSCVVSGSVPSAVAARFIAAGRTLLTGADLRGIATTLAAHEVARIEGPTEVTAAWTVPGKALRHGTGVGFPEPVGARWGLPVPGGIEVPVGGSWAGAAATISSHVDGDRAERVVGVADQRDHLAAIALAAGAIAVARGGYPPGAHTPADNAEAYLTAALTAGLGVAAYSI